MLADETWGVQVAVTIECKLEPTFTGGCMGGQNSSPEKNSDLEGPSGCGQTPYVSITKQIVTCLGVL